MVLAVLEAKGIEEATDVTEVRTSMMKWQPVFLLKKNSDLLQRKASGLFMLRDLRFNPILIAEWMNDLLPEDAPQRHQLLADRLCISRPRVYQFLDLLSIPADERMSLRKDVDVRESHLRRPAREGDSAVPSQPSGCVQRLLGHTVTNVRMDSRLSAVANTRRSGDFGSREAARGATTALDAI